MTWAQGDSFEATPKPVSNCPLASFVIQPDSSAFVGCASKSSGGMDAARSRATLVLAGQFYHEQICHIMGSIQNRPALKEVPPVVSIVVTASNR